MGSTCSILNDTKHDVWITHGVNWQVFIGVTAGLLGLFTAGADVLALDANEAEGYFVTAGGDAILDEAGVATGEVTETSIVGLSKKGWTRLAIVLDLSNAALSKLLSIPQSQAEKMKCDIREFQENAELIKPGNKYTWSGTLSLTMRVYVMNDKLQCDDRGCFTGPTAGSENVYTISENFKKLEVN